MAISVGCPRTVHLLMRGKKRLPLMANSDAIIPTASNIHAYTNIIQLQIKSYFNYESR